jgi:uncharacterized phage protein (TIGR02220 family)
MTNSNGCIQIVDWAKHYENNRTRELKKMAWVPMPNRHDGDGYTRLLDHPNGAAHFGAWCALVEVASRCDVRGTLVRKGGEAIDSGSLERMTRIPKVVWIEALPRLVIIGWIKGYTVSQEGATISQEGATPAQVVTMNGMERKEGKERNITMSGDESPDPVSDLLEEQKTETESIPYVKIIDCLNAEAGTKFNPHTKPTRHLIKARWNEGYRQVDFESVIKAKCIQWKSDPKMVQYLRPQTLFGTKFEAYLNEPKKKTMHKASHLEPPCEYCGSGDGLHTSFCNRPGNANGLPPPDNGKDRPFPEAP